MLTIVSTMFIGLALLAWGGDRFIIGASATARDLGVSSIIIGVTTVGKLIIVRICHRLPEPLKLSLKAGLQHL